MRAAILCLVAALAVVSATTVAEIPYPSSGWTLSHVSTVYDLDAHTTTFTYSITTGSAPLSHWVIATACTGLGLAPGQEWVYKHDASTGLSGFVYPVGQPASTTESYTLVFNGNVHYASVQFGLKGGAKFTVDTTTGPSCLPTDPSASGPCDRPADGTASCDGDLSQPSTGTYPNYIGQTPVSGACPNSYTLVRNFLTNTGLRAFTACQQRLVVKDTEAPTLTPIDTYKVLGCNDPIPAFENVEATDNCDTDVLVHAPCEEITNTTCPANKFIVRTWTATDSCGNSKCVTQTLAVIDNNPPTLHGVPADDTKECNGDFTIPGPPTVTATEDCGNCFATPATPVSYSEEYNPGECDHTYELVRTWTSKDCCGNVASASQRYTVQDTTAPSISLVGGVAPNGTFECSDYPVTPYPAQTHDICMTDAPAYTVNESRHDGSCEFNFVLTRLYSVCDDCGNSNSLLSVISVVDTTAPKWVDGTLPADATYECGHAVEPTDPSATDNCGLLSVTRLPDQIVPGSSPCGNRRTIIRTWVASDKCRNTIEHTQTVTIVDTTPTKLKPLPPLGPYQCYDDVPPVNDPAYLAQIQPQDCGEFGNDCACDLHYVLSYNETVVDNGCLNRKTIVRTYTSTDDCGNQYSDSITIVVNDNTNPLFHGTPSDDSQNCNEVVEFTAPTATDNCDDAVPVLGGPTRVDTACPHQYDLVYSWTASDVCGNSHSTGATLHVLYPYSPVIVGAPPSTTVECHLVPEKPTLTATVPCGTATVNNSIPDVHTPGSCVNKYTLDRSWVATDDCAKTTTAHQTIHVTDTVGPTLSPQPADTEVACTDVPAPPAVCASDNCAGVTLTYTEVRTDYPDCTPGTRYQYKLVRTWTATDACGNVFSHVQTINVFARDAPTLVPSTQVDLHQACDAVSPPPAPTATSPCGSAPVTEHHTREDGSCPQTYILHRSFRAQDACGNTAWLNYSIFVTDTSAPTLPTLSDINNECTTPTPPTVAASDTCDPVPSVTGPVDSNLSSTCANGYVLNRVWTAHDACGNSQQTSQKVTVYDNTKPVFDSTPPATLNFQCAPTPHDVLTAHDNCLGLVSVTYSETNTTGSCPYDYSITRTWRATDVCGNFETFDQTVIVLDTTPPMVGTVPGDEEVQCTPPTAPRVCANDNCAGVFLTFSETVENRICEYHYDLVRTWTARDLCGHTDTKSQRIKVRIAGPPTFNEVNPGDSTVDCRLPTIVPPTAQAACGTVVVSDHSTTEAGDCAFRFKRHVSYAATDLCNQVSWFNYTITVIDNSPPVVIAWDPAAPENTTYTCGEVPPAPTPVLFDFCGGATYSLAPDQYSVDCTYRQDVTRVWTFTDTCHNSATYVQILDGVHTTIPTFSSTPSSKTADCNSTVSVDIVTGFDACGQPLTAAVDIVPRAGTCADDKYEDRVYTLTDSCGLTNVHTQTIFYHDSFSPVISTPSDTTDYNFCGVPPALPATAADNCDPNPTVVDVPTKINPVCDYVYDILHTYTATDRCGNSAVSHATQHYGWTAQPTLFGLPSASHATYECDAVPNMPVVTATDACGNSVSVFQNETRIDGSCANAYTLIRFWSATDRCGGVTTFTQTVDVVDTTSPVLCNTPADVAVQCGFVPEPPTVSASDNCVGLTLTYEQTKLPGGSCCNYQIRRLWTATDACNHVTTHVQIITVYDDIEPVLVGVPPNIPCASAECPFTNPGPNYNVTGYKPALAVGFCANPQLAASTCSDNTVKDSSLTLPLGSSGPSTPLKVVTGTVVQWINGEAFVSAQVSDGSNVYALHLHLTGKNHGTPSGGSPVTTLDPACYGTLPTQVSSSTWDFYSTLTGNLTVGSTVIYFSDTTQDTQIGLGANGQNTNFGALIFLKKKDEIGSGYQLALDLTGDGVGSCAFNHDLFPDLCACADKVTVTFTTNVTAGPCNGTYDIYNTWCAHDESSGVTVCGTQVINVCDTTAPFFLNVPASSTIDCTATVPGDSVTPVDACGEITSFIPGETILAGRCPQEKTYVRTFSATDDCGHTATTGYSIHVQDVTAPVIHGIPLFAIISTCDDISPKAEVTATDDCQAVTPVETPVNTTFCPYEFETRYSYVAADACGNSASSAYSFVVLNPYPVVLHDVPVSETIECPATPTPFTVTASQLCQGDLTSAIVYNEDTDSSNICDVVITRTWSVSDACGHSDSDAQTVHIVDRTAPEWTSSLPTDTTVDCDKVPEPAVLTARDSCTAVEVIYGQTSTGPLSCRNHYVLTRTWTASDQCGHSIVHVQHITVQDPIAPIITPGTVPDVSAHCKAVPAPPAFCATDNCDGVTLDYSQTRNQANPLCDQYSLVRTALATDACGNTDIVTYTVTVNDTVAPSCSGTSDTTQECHLPVSPPLAPTCEDDCSAVTLNSDFPASEKLSCEAHRLYRFHWSASDGCGNTASYTSTITTVDTTAPWLENVDIGGTRECGTAWAPAPPTAHDLCDPNPTLHHESGIVPSLCTGVYRQTDIWWAVDECGNEGPKSTVVYDVVDTTAPYWTSALPDAELTVPCDDVPAAPTQTADDTCGGATVTYNQVRENGTCINQYDLIRTWTAKDCVGNTITRTQIVHVVDHTPPHVSPAPADVTLDCNGDFTVPPICADDDCDGVTLNYHQDRNSFSPLATCEDQYTLFRKWTATDACGNIATTSYTITVNDDDAPVCSRLPESDRVYCLDETAATPLPPICSDHCNTASVIPYTSVTPFCTPSKTKYYSWWIVDQCGNGFWHNVTLDVFDNKPPTFDHNPDAFNITVSCDAVPPPTTMTASDQCSVATVTFDEEDNKPADDQCQSYIIKRTWTATDDCGNAAHWVQWITVQDTHGPTWTSDLPSDWTLPCDVEVVIPTLTAADDCGPAPVVLTEQALTPDQTCANAKKTRYTWTATDNCGHTLVHSAVLTIEDRTPPTITSVPPFVNAECHNVPAPPDVCCTDTCVGVSLSYNVTRVPSGQCDSRYDLVRLWTCVDGCGNVATTTQTVHVTDTTPPVWTTTLPADADYECFNSDSIATLTSVDACTDSNVTSHEETIPGGCDANYTIIRTWTTMDSCGNQQSYIQNVTVHDSIPPYTNETDIVCFVVESYTDMLVINNISVVNNFFSGGDICSPVHVVLTGCSSDQDDVFPGTPSCVYDNATDTLSLSGLLNTLDLEGRMYTITALIVDECGHSVETSRQVFLPLNDNSANLRNLTGLHCNPVHASCEDVCPCQTVDHFCNQKADFGASLEFVNVNTGSGQTTFTYKLVGGSASRVLLNIDTTRYQIISWTPDVNLQFGPQPGSYLTGLTWWSNVTFSAGDEFSFTVVGLITASEVGQVLSQVDSGDFLATDQIPLTDCSVPALVSGPTTAPTFASSTASVSGRVSITGTRFGTANLLNYGLSGVVIALYDSNGTPVTGDDTLLRLAVSDANGQYAFNDIASLTNLKVIIVEEGLFHFRERSSGRFLRATVNNVFGQGRYGPAQDAAASVDFGLLIDTESKPIYNRPAANAGKGFEGSAKPESYWTFLFSEAASGRYYEYSATKLAALQVEASALLTHTSWGTASASLRAAALNAASGRGFFDPYGLVQAWYLSFADRATTSSGTDLTDAAEFLAFINNAADLDRS